MNKPLKAIIVEDELASREILSGYIKKYTTDVEVVALAENVEDGLKAVEKHNPDILFLDIEMPYGNGFDLLEKVKEAVVVDGDEKLLKEAKKNGWLCLSFR